MIVPVRCFNCGKVLAHLWEPYQHKLQEATNGTELEKEKKILVIGEDQPESIECRAMNELGITKMCCRTTMMGTVMMTDDISKVSYSNL